MERISYKAKESHRHETKPLKWDGMAETLQFLKASVHCLEWVDSATCSAAGNSLVFCVLCMFFVSQNVFLFPALSLLFESFVLFFLVPFYLLCLKRRLEVSASPLTSAQLILARLWNRSSCNTRPLQQISHSSSFLSPCTHLEEPACKAMAAASASHKSSAICLLWHWITEERKVSIHCLMGNAMAPGFP